MTSAVATAPVILGKDIRKTFRRETAEIVEALDAPRHMIKPDLPALRAGGVVAQLHQRDFVRLVEIGSHECRRAGASRPSGSLKADGSCGGPSACPALRARGADFRFRIPQGALMERASQSPYGHPGSEKVYPVLSGRRDR